MFPPGTRRETKVEGLDRNDESLVAPGKSAADRGTPWRMSDQLLEVAGRDASLDQVEADSYAELIIAADGISALGRTQPVVILQLGAEFRGIALTGH
jgi:hypothetical protein